ETVAECEGPRGRYRTTVRSARDGRVMFAQDFPARPSYRAMFGPEGDWEYDLDRAKYMPASPFARAVAQGHEVHMLALAPETRFGAPIGVRATTFRGTPAFAVSFRDILGGMVTAYYSRRDYLPLGFMFPDHKDPGSPGISLVLNGWQRRGAIRLVSRAVFWQGRDAYRFRFTRIRLNVVPDSAFVPPRSPTGATH
ncbi:MAG TPA: hypothetical protein VN876_01255, partial [Gemmatimonadaceae bacterium]|nr:hypothetical protein [Gemmatimonadaceae bacterium]